MLFSCDRKRVETNTYFLPSKIYSLTNPQAAMIFRFLSQVKHGSSLELKGCNTRNNKKLVFRVREKFAVCCCCLQSENNPFSVAGRIQKHFATQKSCWGCCCYKLLIGLACSDDEILLQEKFWLFN